MSSNEIRQKFLDFFKKRGHTIVSSGSLLPNDPSVLLTTAGMQQMVPYLLGEKHPLGKRIADSQKCFRSQDIEEVGDNRHTTFFEMLGNWSFGDYFKKEQIEWIFDFLVNEINLNPKSLYITVFRGNDNLNIPRDDESAKIWQEIFLKNGIDAKTADFPEQNGMQASRIFYYDETKNWWSRFGAPEKMPVNELGGPNSEMFWDFGAELKIHENSQFKNNPCHVNCDCGRFFEIGNNVFMEYIKTKTGFDLLPNKNVDFGGGLERILAAKNNTPDIFETDLFLPIIIEISRFKPQIFPKKLSYGDFAKQVKPQLKTQNLEKAKRIITDHIRGAVFLISDGVLPSNVEQGYILRRLLRRAIRYGKLLNLPKNFLIPLAQKVLEIYHDIYPELKSKETEILTAIQKEEERFEKTLTFGLKEFESQILKLKSQNRNSEFKIISGSIVFNLYQSYGFPLELTKELAQEQGLEIDEAGFKKEFEKHQEISRAGAEKKFGGHGIVELQTANYKLQTIKLHTAAHLLHQALRKILGDHVKQMGSNIDEERLRFDFSYSQKMTDEEIKKVEDLVNQKIKENLEVRKEEMNLESALKSGALAFFKEKYPEKVSVYTIFNSQTNEIFSKEICAGPHVDHINELGYFKILKEESCGAGVRRIKAILK